MDQFKWKVTKHIRKMGYHNFKWRRNNYDHITRNENDLKNIREYIFNNPLKWDLDKGNP